jgi:putative methyltransferase
VVLADLSHVKTGTEWSVLPMPVNMGYLAAFASEYFSADVDIRICKAPADLIENVLTFEPHVVAFSNYIWNSNLSATAADWVRKVRPEALIVMGGPNLNSTELEGAAAFLRDRSAVDYYVPQEGEVPFLRILEAFEAKSRSRENLLPHALLGTWSLDSRREKIRETDLEVPMLTPPGGLDVRTGRLLDLNDIPSPFLTGVLDDFLRDPAYVPLIETNRGCPYSCTFCSWGDMAKSKSSSFPVERILKELDFLADNNHSRSHTCT